MELNKLNLQWVIKNAWSFIFCYIWVPFIRYLKAWVIMEKEKTPKKPNNQSTNGQMNWRENFQKLKDKINQNYF